MDILYDPITPPEGSQRKEIKQIDDYISVEYTVTVKDGQEEYEVTSVTVTSHSNMTVTVDSNVVVKPTPPPVYDDCYYVPSDFNHVGCNE